MNVRKFFTESIKSFCKFLFQNFLKHNCISNTDLNITIKIPVLVTGEAIVNVCAQQLQLTAPPAPKPGFRLNGEVKARVAKLLENSRKS